MNVPPVAATHTEWRTCGPPGGYSLPICLNDSDTELSTRGTPISDKVQMIIESLRSSQSSLDMGDEMEGNVLSGQEGHPQVCKVAAGSFGTNGSKAKGPVVKQENLSSPINHESHDSDSDDSVDRGIEEAILEYLKEKDGHKRKAEPCTNILQQSKIPRRNPPVPEVSKQNSESNTFLISSNQFPKSVKAETPTAPAAFPMKKYIKHKASLHERPVQKPESNKSAATAAKSFELPREQTKSPSKTISFLNKVKYPVQLTDSDDSSSDDGIEEAIQRYQLEKEQQNRQEPLKPHAFIDESDSTSDDGIEEAIRCYQLEQLKEKSVLKPFFQKQKPISKTLMHAVGGTSRDALKRPTLKKKNNTPEKEVRSVASHLCIPKNTLSDSAKGKGNRLLSFKIEGFKEHPAPPKANTTAELMCAEAILDISKTVMPGAFHPTVGLGGCAPPTGTCVPSSLPDNDLGAESDDSSIDSEDGIEQEIRKFLEQKAQMHKQPLSSAPTLEPCGVNEPEMVKTKPLSSQKKPQRLSLTQRRRQKEEHSISNMTGVSDGAKETFSETSPEHKKEVCPSALSQTSQTQPMSGLCKAEQSGDKSSSLDSDEDLDTAIKDLLKTKKKSKKKLRDLKRKSRKCLKKDEPLLGNAIQTKKLKPELFTKHSGLKKVQKSKDEMRDKPRLSTKTVSQHKQNISKEHDIHEGETENMKGNDCQDALLPQDAQTALQIKEESSSVDSDDSIEQEIRKFLAEKAKVSTAEKIKDEDESRNGNVMVSTQTKVEGIKQENQLAEIPRKNIPSPSGQSPPDGKQPHSKSPLPVSCSLLPDNSISPVGAQSHLSSVQHCSPGLLEPADGAGAARTEQRRPIAAGGGAAQDAGLEKERVRTVLSSNAAHSRSESIKWRQSLGLPTTDTRTLSRTPFHITSSKMSETSSGAPYQSGGINFKLQTPVSVWSAARTSRSPFPSSTEPAVNATFHSPVLSFLSAARQHPGMPFPQSLVPGFRSQCPIEGDTQSMVHIPKDKSVFVELETNRTNHVQVRNRDRDEGKERAANFLTENREGKSMKREDKEVHLERTEETFIDEAESESGNRRNPEKKQGFSTL